MASKKFEKGSMEFQWFGQFWMLVQNYWEQEGENEKYWEDVIEKMNLLVDAYKVGDQKLWRFSKTMAVAFLSFLENEYKLEKKIHDA